MSDLTMNSEKIESDCVNKSDRKHFITEDDLKKSQDDLPNISAPGNEGGTVLQDAPVKPQGIFELPEFPKFDDDDLSNILLLGADAKKELSSDYHKYAKEVQKAFRSPSPRPYSTKTRGILYDDFSDDEIELNPYPGLSIDNSGASSSDGRRDLYDSNGNPAGLEPIKPSQKAPVRNPRVLGNTRTRGLSCGPEAKANKTFWSGRNFLLTVFNIPQYTTYLNYLTSKPFVYCVVGKEKAPTTDEIHYHIFIQYARSQKLYKSCLGDAHVDVCKGTAFQNMQYVKKDGDIIFEEGDQPKAPKSRKITVKEAIEMPEEALQDIYASQWKHVMQIRRHAEIQEALKNQHYEKTEVYWIYGPTGTGKTRSAVEAGSVTLTYANGFFNDITGSKVILIDDFRGEIPYNLLLKLLDGYKNVHVLNIKGGQMIWNVDKIFITSSLPPNGCYPRQTIKRDSISQLLRRITLCIRYNELGEKFEEDPMRHNRPWNPLPNDDNNIDMNNFS